MSENKVDLNTPVTDSEIQERLAGLSEMDLQNLRDEQIRHAIMNRKPAKAPELGKLTDAEFEAYKRSIGM